MQLQLINQGPVFPDFVHLFSPGFFVCLLLLFLCLSPHMHILWLHQKSLEISSLNKMHLSIYQQQIQIQHVVPVFSSCKSKLSGYFKKTPILIYSS